MYSVLQHHSYILIRATNVITTLKKVLHDIQATSPGGVNVAGAFCYFGQSKGEGWGGLRLYPQIPATIVQRHQ